jgi:DNA primase
LQEFMIGFAPDERSFVSTPLINNSLWNIKTLGFEHKDGANYDFRNRIMFPIHNEKEIS